MCTIDADPDISGIGVRVAIYIQATVSFLQFAFIPLLFGEFRKGRNIPEARNLYRQGRASVMALLVTNVALIMSSTVKAITGGTNTYDDLLVLNLSCMLFLSALSIALVLLGIERTLPCIKMNVTHSISLQDRRVRVFVKRTLPFIKVIVTHAIPLRVYLNFQKMAICTSFAFIGGILSYIDTSVGNQCATSTVYWMFGRVVHITDPRFRRFWSGISWISSIIIPLDIVLSIIIFLFGMTHRVERACARLFPAAVPLGLALLSAILCLVAIVSTEKTITANNVAPGEMIWGFGQAAAIMLVVIPVWQALRTAWTVVALWVHPKSEHEFDLRLLPTASV